MPAPAEAAKPKKQKAQQKAPAASKPPEVTDDECLIDDTTVADTFAEDGKTGPFDATATTPMLVPPAPALSAPNRAVSAATEPVEAQPSEDLSPAIGSRAAAFWAVGATLAVALGFGMLLHGGAELASEPAPARTER